MLIQRMQRRDRFQMPPLASAIPDREALRIVEQWIKSVAVDDENASRQGAKSAKENKN